jgi:hypothetical protein
MCTDGRTDMAKLTVSFRNFRKAINKMTSYLSSSSLMTVISRPKKTQTAFFCNFTFVTSHQLRTAYQFTFKLFTSFLKMVLYIVGVQYVSRNDDRLALIE